MQPRFSVGEKVEVVQIGKGVLSDWPQAKNLIGQVGTVMSNDGDYCVKFEVGAGYLGYYTRPYADGKTWWFPAESLRVVKQEQKESVSAIKSDGGSSSYYQLTIKNKSGESLQVETGDVIEALVGDNFKFGNIIKALRRMYLVTQGSGKEGTSLSYDKKKCIYFLNEIEDKYNSGK